MGSANPDFAFTPTTSQLAETVVRSSLVRTNPDLAELLSTIFARLTDRDHEIESFLNRQVIRRIVQINQLGDDTAHSNTSFINVGPSTKLVYAKANPYSKLVVYVAVAGEFTSDDASRHWISMGVRVDGPNSYVEQKEVARSVGDLPAGDYMTLAGIEAVAVGQLAGIYTVTLQVRTDTTHATWTSRPNATISFSVTESQA